MATKPRGNATSKHSQPGQQSTHGPGDTHSPRDVGRSTSSKSDDCTPGAAPGATVGRATEDGSQAPLSKPTGGTGAPRPGSSGIPETADPNYTAKNEPKEKAIREGGD